MRGTVRLVVGLAVLASGIGIGVGRADGAGPAFSSSPTSGPPGTVISAWYGSAVCPPPGPGAVVTVVLAQPGGAVVAQASSPVFAGGQWFVQFTVPAGAAGGTHVLSATCSTAAGPYLTYSPNSFTVTGAPPPAGPANFSRSPASGPPGTAVTVSSSDPCPPPSGAPSPTARVQLVAPDAQAVVAQGLFPVNASGAWSGQVSVPAGAAAGAYSLRAVCARSSADVAGTIYATYTNQSAFTVTAPPPPPPPLPPYLGNSVQISSDPFTNTTSQHQTQVEPDTFAYGSTVVSAFQSGRFNNGGASDLGWATSQDGGQTWTHGFLPSMTVHSSPAGPYDRATDPSVAYDPRHRTWLISALVMTGSQGVAVTVSRSADGLSWSAPVVVVSRPGLDKNWVVCDIHGRSAYYGNCYVTVGDLGTGARLLTSTSTDGGRTWAAALGTADNAAGIGGQPLVQPNGTVIVPVANSSYTAVGAYRSLDGGASWSGVTTISSISRHLVAGGLRSPPLPSAELDGAGRVYVAWADCRFRSSCAANDIVLSNSVDGVSWSAVTRVPIDAVSSGVDHFLPGLGVDRSTLGAGAHLALTYYFYPSASCTAATCELHVGAVTSNDAGATWTAPMRLSPAAMSLGWLATTTQGPMVGDYLSTSFAADGRAVGVFALATAPDATLHESMFAAVLP
ncbi:MAG: exo-alpha-sialidase [Acidimicrobiales bacterium]